MSEPDHGPESRRARPQAGATDRPLGLLAARHVPLSADQEQAAVDALAGLLAALIGRHGRVNPVLEVQPGGEVSSADTATPAPGEE